MALDGIIFGGMINLDEAPSTDKSGVRRQDSSISYSSVRRNGGAHRIASFLRQNGLDVEVVDFAPSWTVREFQELIRSRMSPSFKFVGLGALFRMNTEILYLCFSWLKKTYPDVTIITGSTQFHNIHLIPADYMVTGYGEHAMLEILKGTAKWTEEVINKEGDTRRTVDAVKHYPAFPMRNLSVDYEKRDFMQPFEHTTIETSRGCRFKCGFCTYPVLGVKKDHTRDAQDFHDNLVRNYDNWGLYRYSIADETFNDYTDKIIKYADEVEKFSFKPLFGGYIRADLLHTRPEDIEHLSRMNFSSQFYGIESFHRPSAKSIGKGMDPALIQQAILDSKAYCLEHNGYYRGTISLIAGLQHETEETLTETLNWCKEHWKTNNVMIHPLVIPSDTLANSPQSKLSSQYEKQGFTLIEVEQLTDDHPELVPIFQSNQIEPELKNQIRLYMRHLTPSVLFHRWQNNMGMSEKDAVMWVIKNFWSKDSYLDFGVDHWRMDDWYVCGYTDEDMMKSFRQLGGVRAPMHKKVDFIENYKKKKLDYVTT
jgi:radical SAM superfamily enzyme YgiQ (UPF0313 family)